MKLKNLTRLALSKDANALFDLQKDVSLTLGSASHETLDLSEYIMVPFLNEITVLANPHWEEDPDGVVSAFPSFALSELLYMSRNRPNCNLINR